jgi:hypothetical protein
MGGGRGISSFELAWIALTVREGVGWGFSLVHDLSDWKTYLCRLVAGTSDRSFRFCKWVIFLLRHFHPALIDGFISLLEFKRSSFFTSCFLPLSPLLSQYVNGVDDGLTYLIVLFSLGFQSRCFRL